MESFTAAIKQVTHLRDVDEMWESLSAAHDSIRCISGMVETIQKTISRDQEDINRLLVFAEKLYLLNHLMEINEIWKQTEDHQIRIKRVEQEDKSHTDKLSKLVQADDRMCKAIDSNLRDIISLKEYKDKLGGISHLDDVDNIWTDVEEHTSQLIEREQREEELAVAIQKNRNEVDKDIADAVQTVNAAVILPSSLHYQSVILGNSKKHCKTGQSEAF